MFRKIEVRRQYGVLWRNEKSERGEFMINFDEVDDIDFDLLHTIVAIIFRGETKDDYERRMVWGYHDVLYIMTNRYKLSYKEQLFVMYNLADYSDTVAYMKTYKCSYEVAKKNAYKMKKRPHVRLAMHEVWKVRMASVMNAAFYRPFIVEHERMMENTSPEVEQGLKIVREKLREGEEFRWTRAKGFVNDENNEVIAPVDEELEQDPDDQQKEIEREELERLREENKNLVELVQDQAQEIFELKKLINNLKQNKKGAVILETPFYCKEIIQHVYE